MKAAEYRLMAKYATRHWWYVAKRSLLINVFQYYIQPKVSKLQLLDIGPGTGSNWLVLKSYGEVTGVEQSALAAKFCRALGWKNVWVGKVQDYAFRENNFDVVTILDVLYHAKITDDVAVLRKVYQTLRPAGWLIVTDSAGPGWFGPHDVANEARERYTLPEMVQKIESAGFAVRHQSYLYASTFLLFMVSRLLERWGLLAVEKTETLPPVWINHLLIMIMKLEVKLATHFRLPWGSSVFVVAQKLRV